MYAIAYLAALFFTMLLLSVMRRSEAPAVIAIAALFFGLVGFCLVPRGGDLYVDQIRFFQTLDAARSAGLGGVGAAWSCLVDVYGYDSTPVAGLIVLLVSMTSHNGWLTFIAGAVDVAAGLYLVWRGSEAHGSKRALVLGAALFLCLFNFTAAVSGVRTNLAGSLACCIAYAGLAKSDHHLLRLLLFVPLVLVHPFSAMIALVYLIASMGFFSRTIPFMVACAVLLCQRIFQDYVFQLFDALSWIPFFASLSFKSTQYFGDTAYIGSSTVYSRYRVVLYFLFVALLAVLALRCKRAKDLPLSKYDRYVILFLCFATGSFFDEQLFSRCVSLLEFMVLPLACDLLAHRVGLGAADCATPIVPLVMLAEPILLVDNLRVGVRFFEIDPSFFAIGVLVAGLAAIAVFYSARRSRGLRASNAWEAVGHAMPVSARAYRLVGRYGERNLSNTFGGGA